MAYRYTKYAFQLFLKRIRTTHIKTFLNGAEIHSIPEKNVEFQYGQDGGKLLPIGNERGVGNLKILSEHHISKDGSQEWRDECIKSLTVPIFK